jgi:hypothetical protein
MRAPVFDTDAERVIARVAREAGRRDALAAQTPALRKCLGRLAARGFLHTFESTDYAGHGLSIGRIFILTGLEAGSLAAKVAALSALEGELAERGYNWLDLTAADSKGALRPCETMARADFVALLAHNPDGEKPGRWSAFRTR